MPARREFVGSLQGGAVCALALGVGLLVVGCEKSSRGPLIIRVGHVGTPGSHYDAATTRFKERVEAELRGGVEIRVFPASQLGGDQEMLNGLRLGTLEMHVPSSVLHPSEPLLSLFELPFLFQDRAQVRRVVSGPVGERIRAALRKQDLELLAFWENGFRVITNNGRPVVRPEDLRGIKLRTPKDPERVKLFKLLGASPTSMAFGELFTALRQGVVDGQENPLSQVFSARLYEVQKYLSVSRHVYSPAYPLMSRRFFDSLPQDVRRALREIAVEVGDYHRELGETRDAEYLAECRKHLQVTEIDRAAFEAASAPLYDEFTRRHGPELVEAVRAAGLADDHASQPAPGEKARSPR